MTLAKGADGLMAVGDEISDEEEQSESRAVEEEPSEADGEEPAAEEQFSEVTELPIIEETDDTVTFSTNGFSVFGLIYTVDFHWEADGEEYEYSIPGGGFISFYKLVEALGIEADDADTEKDEIQELVDGVDGILFCLKIK